MLVLDRPSNGILLDSLPRGPVPRPSAAHTGAIFVVVAGSTPLRETDRGREVARLWLERLATFEGRLDDEMIGTWARFPGRGDGIEAATVRANRALLLQAIEAARNFAYSSLLTFPEPYDIEALESIRMWQSKLVSAS